jgi:hypothetical protein
MVFDIPQLQAMYLPILNDVQVLCRCTFTYLSWYLQVYNTKTASLVRGL